MKWHWAVPILASILILGTLGISHSFAQLCPLTGCLTDNLYVSGNGFDTVRQYDSAGPLLDADFAPGLSDPRAIAFDSTGKLYVADDGLNTVRQYDSAGTLLDANYITGLSVPLSLAFDTLQAPVGGTIIPIDTTALLVAGAQTISPWLILGVLSLVGIGLAVFTLKRSR